jgi:hypothetical protein
MGTTTAAAVIVACIALFVRLRLSYLNLSPELFKLPDLPHFIPDNRLANVQIQTLGNNDLIGPECLAITPNGQSMFASLGDGRIVKLQNINSSSSPTWTTVIRTGPGITTKSCNDTVSKPSVCFVRCGAGGPSDDHSTFGPSEYVCGRPLGLWLSSRKKMMPVLDDNHHLLPRHDVNVNDESSVEYDDDVLLVADAYHGLLMITNIHQNDNSNSSSTTTTSAKMHILATRADTDPINYKFQLLNSLVQHPNGDIYMTETSTKFARRRIFHAVMEGTSTGRLLRYYKGSVTVMADRIYMANGLTISHDGLSLLIVSGVQILQYDIDSATLHSNPFVSTMVGTGDNIKTMNIRPNGQRVKCYWAGMGGMYKRPFSLLHYVCNKLWLRSLLLAVVPYSKIINLVPKWTALAIYNEDGILIETLTYDGGGGDGGGGVITAPWISEVEPMGHYLYLASWYNPFLARIDTRDIKF